MIYTEVVKIDFELMLGTVTVFINLFDQTEKMIELIDDNFFIELKRK